MVAWLQFINLNGLLLLGGGSLLVAAGWLACRRASWRGWAAWAATGAALVGVLIYLRTPPATLRILQPATAPDGPSLLLEDVLTFESPAAIRRFIAASGGRPTLVDVYADYGFS